MVEIMAGGSTGARELAPPYTLEEMGWALLSIWYQRARFLWDVLQMDTERSTIRFSILYDIL